MKSTAKRKVISGLSSQEYEHPLDRVALENLKKIPILPKLVEAINTPYDSIIRLIHGGSFLRASDKQMPSIYKLLREACDILEVEEPELYVSSEAQLNAYTGCPDKPIICVSGYLIDIMDETELMFVLGHELAHIKSGHITYSAVANVIRQGVLDAILASIPGMGLVSGSASIALNYAFFQWYQAGELSCDRGGYLACQDFKASSSALMKLAGTSKTYIKEQSLDAFIDQARNFESTGFGALGNIQKIILSYMAATHPYTVSRGLELLKFEESGKYSNILQRKPIMAEEAPPEATQDKGKAAGEALGKAKNLAGGMLSKLKK